MYGVMLATRGGMFAVLFVLFVVSPIAAQAQSAPSPRVELPNEATFFSDAAATAWKQIDRLWVQRTGLALATPDYDRLTPWDIGSVIGALYCAHRLELLSDEQYHTRLARTLKTLETMPLFRGTVYHRMYFARSAKMVGRKGGPTTVGYGWSGTDLGRLLNWLSIIDRTEPQYHAAVTRITDRIKFETTTKDGYMLGGRIGTHGKLFTWQEGRIGYEQYAARGYQYFGAAVDKAADVNLNATPVTVLGVPLLADKRGLDRLNSEPFVLMGMEFGFTPDMEKLARNVLAAQEARFKQTGKLTMVSEDAVNVAPYYFYYYCVYCNGRAFVVDIADTGKSMDEPRWVSTKASFGYHALFGTDYTKRVLEQIANAKTSRGWSSGVFEKSGKTTGAYDINTAAIVLEAALYRKRMKPFIDFGS